MTVFRIVAQSKLFVAIVAGIALSGCGDGLTNAQVSDLERAERRWQQTGFASGSYLIQQRRLCFCPNGEVSYEVKVRNGAIVSVRNPATGLIIPESQMAAFRSVEQMFAELRTGLGTGAVTEVQYDNAWGYPTVLSLDPVKNAVDDEVTYRSSNVTPVP